MKNCLLSIEFSRINLNKKKHKTNKNSMKPCFKVFEVLKMFSLFWNHKAPFFPKSV